jgi:hypothetical protein
VARTRATRESDPRFLEGSSNAGSPAQLSRPAAETAGLTTPCRVTSQSRGRHRLPRAWGPPTRDDVEPVGAGLECTDDLGRDANDIPDPELLGLVVKPDPAVGLLLLPVAASHRAAPVRGVPKETNPRSPESRCLRPTGPRAPPRAHGSRLSPAARSGEFVFGPVANDTRRARMQNWSHAAVCFVARGVLAAASGRRLRRVGSARAADCLRHRSRSVSLGWFRAA